jgi:hypothetical protein
MQKRITEIDWRGLLTLVLLIVTVAIHIDAMNFTTPNWLDPFFGLAIGYWFGSSKGQG